jgi:5,6-dimethylbenzimidazole synthase
MVSTGVVARTSWLSLFGGSLVSGRARGEGGGALVLEPAALRAPLQLPDSWQWIAYLCIGYPEAHATAPELEAAGWESRVPLDDVIFSR